MRTRWKNKAAVSAVTAIIIASTSTAAFANSTSLHGVIKDSGLWSSYKGKFVKKNGSVVDNGNKNVSHSEGQGFAMIMAVAADDKPAFKRIWKFTQDRLGIRKDGLFAWRYRPGVLFNRTDSNNATDGDILIAWALLEASNAGFGMEYAQKANRILKGVKRLVVGDRALGRFIQPAAYGFSPGHQNGRYVVNLSYWVFPAFERISAITGDPSWLKLGSSGKRLLQLASQNKAGLPADWTAIRRNYGTVETARNFGAKFSYNAVRVPLYLAWADNKDQEGLALFQNNWIRRSNKLPQVDVRWNIKKGSFSELGYQAVAATVNCAIEGRAFPRALKSKLDRTYYPASLHILSVIAIKQRYPKCWN